IKLFVNVPELKQDTERIVNRFKNHPANAGYYIRDEPNAADFTGLAALVKQIQAFDDSRFCYINLFPNYASEQQLGSPSYREHVSTFVKTVPVKVLSFDHYPITHNGIRPEWFENLEIIADAANKENKPFWAFALAVAHGPYPIPSLSHLKLQVYSNLAYGAQGIQYFTYWTPESNTWDFHDGPIDVNGKRTVVYRRIKQVNSEIRALSGIFLGARVLSIGHAGDIPRGAKPYKVMSPFEKIDPIDNNAIISWLENDGIKYLVVVNRQLDSNMHLHIEIEPGKKVMKIQKTGDLVSVPVVQDIIVTPGDAAFFTW
ncbi:beta-galactosidase, partial [Candidatus Omnitrophota bacterium]